MLYNITIKDSAGAPIPGAQLQFMRAGGTQVALFVGDQSASFQFDSEMDSELFNPGNTVNALAAGFNTHSIPVSQLGTQSTITLAKKVNLLLSIGIDLGIAAVSAWVVWQLLKPGKKT